MLDYSDGANFKVHPLYKEHPGALQIQLYYDELEICNPLGSKALKHKLGMLGFAQYMVLYVLVCWSIGLQFFFHERFVLLHPGKYTS